MCGVWCVVFGVGECGVVFLVGGGSGWWLLWLFVLVGWGVCLVVVVGRVGWGGVWVFFASGGRGAGSCHVTGVQGGAVGGLCKSETGGLWGSLCKSEIGGAWGREGM